MVETFSKTLSELRKEQNLSQKQAAKDLGISQALLSHYEKGIRECGLSFLSRAAGYYNVSTDYLLGRSPMRGMLTENPIPLTAPETEPGSEPAPRPSVSGYYARLTEDSLTIVFGLLEKINSDALTREVANWLCVLISELYQMLNRGAGRGGRERKSPELVRHRQQELYFRMALHERRCRDLLTGNAPAGTDPPGALPAMTKDMLVAEFHTAAHSLAELMDLARQALPGVWAGTHPEGRAEES